MHGGIHLGETGLALHVGGDLYDVILEGSGFTVHRCPGAFLSRTPRAGAAPMPPRPAQGQAVGPPRYRYSEALLRTLTAHVLANPGCRGDDLVPLLPAAPNGAARPAGRALAEALYRFWRKNREEFKYGTPEGPWLRRDAPPAPAPRAPPAPGLVRIFARRAEYPS